MKTYAFKVVVEPDEDRWFAYCPTLEKYGAATWGYTKEEALKHIREVVEMVVEELIEDGELIPESPQEEVTVFPESRVAVTI
ncbi:type II toxin-antitoxin system HicB family antitoxin [Candidatus Poribacteria bacterium]|nr:type II toxin-antitoxin system HicB family antitoxin [Candidatus Poribacteria bacterium]